MANSLCFTPFCSFQSPNKPGIVIGNSVGRKVLWVNEAFQKSQTAKFQSLEVKAAENNQSTKPSSIVCSDCDGNGAISCGQCKGSGVNSVDHFNGQFKAGGLCWLCRGKRDILCGSCNGAGFLGGFMSTFDE
ncbi:hypothetical protein FH972_003377 [Carpinus fangiana]|uniref:BSD2 cysteine rich domain-containing protein n=1 Tax=Carpinus fangiana TaxID=176857 RepID=A0A5N6QJP2_9ROSI|nr:hypothetical protein FH972_003377 [Carpinus fangiana]